MLLETFVDASYGRPEAFWLTCLCIPLVFLMRKQSIFVVLLRCAVIALLALAIADPFEVETDSEEELSAVIDVSSSMSSKALRASLKELADFDAPEAKISLIPFAKKPGEAISLEPGWSETNVLSQLEAARGQLDAGDTDLSAALWSAENQSSSASILVLSDGFETQGSAREAATDLTTRGIKIFPLLADESAFLDSALTLESVYAPLTLNSGEKATIRTTIKNSFSELRKGNVEVWLDSKKLETKSIEVGAGAERLVTVESPEIKGGLKRIRTVLRIDGEEPQELHRWISVKERSKVLILSGKDEDARTLPRLLRLKGYALDSRVLDGSERAPDSLENFSTVLLNNAAKRQLPKSFLPKLEKFVAAGGGLIILGGDRSFGLGGYIDTPLETVSPLKFVPPQTRKKRVRNGVVLVLDKSKSMAYQGKIHAAKLAALTSISALKDDDLVSVIGFDSAPFVIIRLAKVSEVKPGAERRLRNLTAAGKTNLWPALAAARQALRSSDAGRKHIIVLSDGKIPLGRNNYPEELRRARKEGITISAVALGAEADLQFMRFMAKNGKGAFLPYT